MPSRAVLLTIRRPGPGFCGTCRRCRPDLPVLCKRPGPGSGGQRVRAIPQPQERDGCDHRRRQTCHHRRRGHSRRGACRRRAGSHRGAARREGVPGHRGRIRQLAGLAGRVRDRRPGRHRGHGQLRRGPCGCRLFIRAGQAACRYSWRVPPSRSRLRTSSCAIRSRSAIGSGSGRKGAAARRVRWGRCSL
jgi:hypothetical protein